MSFGFLPEESGRLAPSLEFQPGYRVSLRHSRKSELERRGFLQTTGGTLKPACKIIERYARLRSPGVADIRRLFGSTKAFEENIQSTLELRLSQIPQIDSSLNNYIQRAIQDISPSPKESLMWMRNIAERALDLIWEKELPHDRSIPASWIAEWQRSDEWRDNRLDSRLGAKKQIPPGKRGDECNILRLATGTLKADPVTRYITKSTYVLLNNIKVAGDFRNHYLESRDFISVGTAASFCMSAIALCESLYHDLSRS